MYPQTSGTSSPGAIQGQTTGPAGVIRVPPLTPPDVEKFTSLFEKSGAVDGILPGRPSFNIASMADRQQEKLRRAYSYARSCPPRPSRRSGGLPTGREEECSGQLSLLLLCTSSPRARMAPYPHCLRFFPLDYTKWQLDGLRPATGLTGDRRAVAVL